MKCSVDYSCSIGPQKSSTRSNSVLNKNTQSAEWLSNDLMQGKTETILYKYEHKYDPTYIYISIFNNMWVIYAELYIYIQQYVIYMYIYHQYKIFIWL